MAVDGMRAGQGGAFRMKKHIPAEAGMCSDQKLTHAWSRHLLIFFFRLVITVRRRFGRNRLFGVFGTIVARVFGGQGSVALGKRINEVNFFVFQFLEIRIAQRFNFSGGSTYWRAEEFEGDL